MQWKYHGQTYFICPAADAVRNIAADVQCRGYYCGRTFQQQSGTGGGWLYDGTDQRVRQSVYRCFSWNKRPCGKVLCRRKGQRDVRGCAYLHLICTDKRYCDGDNRSASGKAGIAAYADTCGCD